MRSGRQVMTLCLLAGAGLAAALPARASASASAPAGSLPGRAAGNIRPANNPLQLWALQSENRDSNYIPVAPDQALLDAFHFAYLIAHVTGYEGQVAAMKAINPRLVILAYENALFAQRWQGTTYPDSWYLRDINGNKVRSQASGNFLMNPTDPGWIQDRVTTCQELIAQSGYDGCYLDMLGIASLSPGFVSALPVDPRTGQLWTAVDWIMATAGLAGQVTAGAAPSLVMGNGINSGALYYSHSTPTKPILDALDGGIAEAWLRGSTAPITRFPEGLTWLEDIQLIGAAESAGKPLLGYVKNGIDTATPTQLQAWQQFGLATFLMGVQARSAYLFSPNFDTSRTTWYSLYDLILGPPSGSMAKLSGTSGSVYTRAFEFGLAVVNDTAQSVPVTLTGGPYYDVTGAVVATSPLTVGPDMGLVLRTRVTPVTTVTGGPSSPTTMTSARIWFTSAPGTTFTCALDGAGPEPCTSPVAFSGLALGPHLVSVQATARTGTVGVPTPYAWDINTGSPPAVSLSGPANGSGSMATFTFSATSPESSFTCSLDRATPALCTSPQMLTGLTTGVSHMFTVSVTDPYGVAGTPATWTWTP